MAGYRSLLAFWIGGASGAAQGAAAVPPVTAILRQSLNPEATVRQAATPEATVRQGATPEVTLRQS